MRRNICNILCRRPTTIAASFSTAADGGRGFLPTNLEKSNVRTSHTLVKVKEAKFADIFGVFSGKGRLPQSQSAVVTAGKAVGILFRGYAGRATQDDEITAYVEKLTKIVTEASIEDQLDLFEAKVKIAWQKFDFETRKSLYEVLDKVLVKLIDEMAQDDRDDGARSTQNGRVDKLAKMRKRIKEDQDVFKANVFHTILEIECQELDLKTCKCVYEVLDKVLDKLLDKATQDYIDDVLGAGARATQNDRVDKLAEIGEGFEEKLDAFLSHSFVNNLLIECEPEYKKRFLEVLMKVREKMTQDDRKLEAFVFVTNLMNKCEPEYEELLLKVLEKVRDKITEEDTDEKVGSEKMSKIMKLARLHKKAQMAVNVGNISKMANFEEELDAFVTQLFLFNLKRVENRKPYFKAYEVIEKVAKKVGYEDMRKVAEAELEAFATNLFVTNLVKVEMMKPFVMSFKLLEMIVPNGWRIKAEEEWEGKRLASEDRINQVLASHSKIEDFNGWCIGVDGPLYGFDPVYDGMDKERENYWHQSCHFPYIQISDIVAKKSLSRPGPLLLSREEEHIVMKKLETTSYFDKVHLSYVDVQLMQCFHRKLRIKMLGEELESIKEGGIGKKHVQNLINAIMKEEDAIAKEKDTTCGYQGLWGSVAEREDRKSEAEVSESRS